MNQEETKKYQITDIAHPEHPSLHRIRALRDVGDAVKTGDLGGYVQSEDNLSQEGRCWVFGNAIACEEAYVHQDAIVSGNAVIRGSALVAGSAQVSDRAIIEDNAVVTAGCVELDARISGNAQIGANPTTKCVPLITQDAIVYGTVFGQVTVSRQSVILPGVKIDMPTRDTLHIEGQKVCVQRSAGQQRPMSEQVKEKNKRSEPER